MCGLFGFSYYGDKEVKNVSGLLGALGKHSTERGTDATGIAYNIPGKDRIEIRKAPQSAYIFNFSVPSAVRAVLGHTRRTTQGNEKQNYNNHPFFGMAGQDKFAFAHNGVLDNEFELRSKYRLPHTKIETDSYVAVQLLETGERLDIDNIKFMAEQVEGMFTFTILDQHDNLYVVKNDSPFIMAHFPDLSLYVYASTEEILVGALMDYMPTREILMSKLMGRDEKIEWFKPEEGDILVVRNDGTVEKYEFEPQIRTWGWYGKNSYLKHLASGYKSTSTIDRSLFFKTPEENAYFDILVDKAWELGVDEEELLELLNEGFSVLDIEDALYDGTIWDMIDLMRSGLSADYYYSIEYDKEDRAV